MIFLAVSSILTSGLADTESTLSSRQEFDENLGTVTYAAARPKNVVVMTFLGVLTLKTDSINIFFLSFSFLAE